MMNGKRKAILCALLTVSVLSVTLFSVVYAQTQARTDGADASAEESVLSETSVEVSHVPEEAAPVSKPEEQPTIEWDFSVATEEIEGIYSPGVAEAMKQTPKGGFIAVEIDLFDFHLWPAVYNDICDEHFLTPGDKNEYAMRVAYGDELIDKYLPLVLENVSDFDWEIKPWVDFVSVGLPDWGDDLYLVFESAKTEIGKKQGERINRQQDRWEQETYLESYGGTLAELIAERGGVSDREFGYNIEVSMTAEELLELGQAEWIFPQVRGRIQLPNEQFPSDAIKDSCDGGYD